MSDASQTAEASEPRRDPTLLPRRIVAFALSIILGIAVVAAGILLILKTDLSATVPISFLNIPLLPLATIPAAFFFLIWIDYFMGTGIVVD